MTIIVKHDCILSDEWRYSGANCRLCNEPAITGLTLCESCKADSQSDIAYCLKCNQRVFSGHMIDDDEIICNECLKEKKTEFDD